MRGILHRGQTMFTQKVLTLAEAGSGNAGEQGDATTRRVPVPSRRGPSSGDRGSGCREKGAPKASSLHFDTCARIAGTVSLRQTRCADMPDATNPFASRLAGARIT